MEHEFTPVIIRILEGAFGARAHDLFKISELLQYLNNKTRSASRGSKSRGSFASLYAIYVLVEDYVNRGFDVSGAYQEYEGARFTDLFKRQRELPFGSKLQNHALNSRMNDEFRKYFPTCEHIPISRDAITERYWINNNLLLVEVAGEKLNIARTVLRIIDEYVKAKKSAFEAFIAACQRLQALREGDPEGVRVFVTDLLQPNVDARVFEIVSYAILKEYYAEQNIYWGWTETEITEESLVLYKTGRTNANDGGIDFVMKPLGRFFQVTETVDVRKYFLDIDKVQRYPITFVVKSSADVDIILEGMRAQARKVYGAEEVVGRYMECIEEIINIPALLAMFAGLYDSGRLGPVLEEISLQSQVEFNYL